MNNNTIGIAIILGILAIIAFGGTKHAQQGGFISSGTNSTTQTKTNEQIAKQIRDAQKEVDDLKKKIQAEEDAKTKSPYASVVSLENINRGGKTASQEYITIKVSGKATSTILVTGWTIKSLASGNTVTIPKGTYLFFTNSINTEDPIQLVAGDRLYINTGLSPNGASFKLNRCSGYLTQFQTFIPYISANCPAAKDEDLSSIPNRVINDACFDYIDRFPRCKIQTTSLPQNWSYECTNFIYTKLNYASCVDTHKNDKNFYMPEWRVYLKRSDRLWKDKRESIVLYDLDGKIVDTLTY